MQEETANNQLTPDGLQILLFVDHRPSSQKQIEDILDYLEHLRIEYKFTLQVVSVEAEPYLAEYFKIMATPALIKVAPEPRHILAGSNLILQLRNLWPYWQNAVEEYEAEMEQNVDNYYINSKTITS
ncbi:MAG TPA: circadian clock KaiB family protein, partial [Allocoleopsis sp.]